MQVEVANHRKVRRLRVVVLSVAEKAHEMRQVCVEKASESEPLMTCRKRPEDIKTERGSVSRDEFRGCPADRLNGVRHEGGASSTQALMWNGRTCRVDDKGKVQAARNSKNESTDATHRGGLACSSDEGSVMELEQRRRIAQIRALVNREVGMNQ